MSITKEQERQYPLYGKAEFTYADLVSGAEEPAVKVPAGAVVVGGGMLVITEEFNSGTSDTGVVGDGVDDDRYAAGVDMTATGMTELVPDGYEYNVNDDVSLKWTGAGAAPTTGAGYILVPYIDMNGKAQEIVPE